MDRGGVRDDAQSHRRPQPPVLKSEGLAEALVWLRSQVREKYDLEVDIETDENDVPSLEKDMRVLLFQCVRELLFNVVKHAGVGRARVAVGAEEEHVVVRVSDEGRGFDPEQIEAHGQDEEAFGLYSVRERLGLFGGQMTIDAAPGEGTRVTLRVPLRSNPEAAAQPTSGPLLGPPSTISALATG